jgi:hypothetical protein
MEPMYVTIGVLGYVSALFILLSYRRAEQRGKREKARCQVERENSPPFKSSSKLKEDPSEAAKKAVKISVGFLKDEMNASTSPDVKESIAHLLVLLEKEI